MNDAATEHFLVTGALGCLGAWTVKRLLDEGAHVVTLDKGSDPRRLRLLMDDEHLERVVMLEGDISDLATVERALDEHDIDRVIHLAALQVPFARADPPLGALVNVVGTVNVFEAVKRRRRAGNEERMGPVVYAGSVGMFAASDADPRDGSLHEDAVAHPSNHYGIYKLANEGNARIYWQDDGVPSVGLRPMVVYGPGRDQGMTSGPTRAILAALVRRPFEIGFGGRALFQYAPDVAAAFIAASRSQQPGARTYNLSGSLVSMPDYLGALEGLLPEAAGLVTYRDEPLPFPEWIRAEAVAELGSLPLTPLEEALAATVALFRDQLERGRLVPAEHGLAA